MKKTYKNRLPKNMEASSINAKVVDGEVIVEVEMKEKFEPKDGDFLAVKETSNIFIYSDRPALLPENACAYCGSYGNEKGNIQIEFSDNWTRRKDCRYATPKEKTKFLERLKKECHKRWNSETKQIEDIRWEPKARERYFYADYDGEVRETVNVSICDAFRISMNNCFKTKEAAKPYAEQMKKIFKNSKAE